MVSVLFWPPFSRRFRKVFHAANHCSGDKVGDVYDRDIIGAGTVGLFTGLIDIHAVPLPEGAVPPDVIVPALGDVLAALPIAALQGAPVGTQKRSGV